MDASNIKDRIAHYENLQWEFSPGSREWLFARAKAWAKTRSSKLANKAWILLGPAGIGKSMFALELCERYYVTNVFASKVAKMKDITEKEKQRVINRVRLLREMFKEDRIKDLSIAGFYFFNTYKNWIDMKECLFSLSEQLKKNIRGFQPQRLKRSDDIRKLFTGLLAEPSRRVRTSEIDSEGKLVCLIDGINESEQYEELLEIIKDSNLPRWFGFILTARRPQDGTSYEGFTCKSLEPTDTQNKFDIDLFLRNETAGKMDPAVVDEESVLRYLSKRSQGYFLYLRFLKGLFSGNPQTEDEPKSLLSFDDIVNAADVLPEQPILIFHRLLHLLGSDMYKKSFCMLYAISKREDSSSSSCVSVPLHLFQYGCGFVVEDTKFIENFITETGEIVYFDRDTGTIRIFHKDLFNWNDNDDDPWEDGIYPSELSLNEVDGHQILGKSCIELQNHSTCEEYIAKYIIWHLCVSRENEEIESILTSEVSLLNKILSKCDILYEIQKYHNDMENVSRALSLVIGVLQKGQEAITHDPREIGSQILGRITQSNISTVQTLYESALKQDFGGFASWVPLKPSLEHADSSLLKLVEGHDGPILALAKSHDERYVFTGGFDKYVKKWRLRDLKQIGAYFKHNWPVTSIAVSHASSDIFVSVSDGGEVILWNKGRTKRLKGHVGSVNCVVFPTSASQNIFATAGMDTTVRVWNVHKTNGKKRQYSLFSPYGLATVTMISFALDSTILLCGSDDGKIRSFSLGGDPVTEFNSMHKDTIICLSIDPTNQKSLLSASADGILLIWDVETGELRQEIREESEIADCSFSTNGSTILSCASDSIHCWGKAENDSWEIVQSFEGHSDQVNRIVSTKTSFASVSADCSIRLWSLESTLLNANISIGNSENVDQSVFVQHEEDDSDDDDNENDIFLNAKPTLDDLRERAKNTKVSSPSTNRGVNETAYNLTHQDWIIDCCFSSRSDFCASISSDGTIGIWELNFGKNVCFINPVDSKWNCMSFSPSDRLFAAGCNKIVIFDIDSWAPTHEFRGSGEPIIELRFADSESALEAKDAEGQASYYDLIQMSDVSDLSGISWTEQSSTELNVKGKHIGGPDCMEDFVGFTVDSSMNVKAKLAPNGRLAAVVEGKKIHFLRMIGGSSQRKSNA